METRLRQVGLAVVAALALLGGSAEAGAATLQPGDIIVGDLDLNNDGGLILVDPASGKQTTLSTNGQPVNAGSSEFLDDPYDATVMPDGTVLAAEEVDAGDPSDGGVVGVNPRTGKQRLISNNALGSECRRVGAVHRSLGCALSAGHGRRWSATTTRSARAV